MKPRSILIGLAVIAGVVALVIFGGGMLIDGAIDLRTQKELHASPAAIFRFLDDAAGIDRWWSVAQEGSPQPRMTVNRKEGPERGAGMRVTFETADGSVLETWRVKSADPPHRIVYDVDFAGVMTVERTITLTPTDGGTRAEWREAGTIESPVLRWTKVLMPPDGVIANFDRALDALDRAATSTISR